MLRKSDHYAKRLGLFLIIAALIAGMAGCTYNRPPYQNLKIRTWYDLDNVRNNLAGNHTLMNDLNSTTPGYEELAGPAANGGKGWESIGHRGTEAFNGSLDGRGYEIQDVFINRSDEHYVGLFGAVNQSGLIKNVGVMNATVIGLDDVGGLAGLNEGTVANSYSSGDVTANIGFVGGLVGVNAGTVANSYSGGSVTGEGFGGGLVGANVGTVSNSYCTGNVTGNLGIGGLVGANGYSDYPVPLPGTVSDSYSTGSVTGNEYVGGLVGGSTHGSTVSNSYSTGSIAGNSSVGGLVGGNEGSIVTDSYSVGNVTAVDNVGGLVGENLNDGNISNSYSAGSVTGNSSVGGLVGYSLNSTVTNSFWDTETSGQATSDGGTGKNTTEMKDITTFSVAAWNITAVALNETNLAYIWNIVNNVTYPFLSWEA